MIVATPFPKIRNLRVGYILKRFPKLSETFILNEILELERQGVTVEIFSLLRPLDEPRHALLSQLRARVTYLPSGSAVDGIVVRRPDDSGELRKHGLVDAMGDGAFDDVMRKRTKTDAAMLVLRAASVAMLARTCELDHLHAHFGSDATTVAMLASRLSGLAYSYTAHARDIYHTYIDAETDRRMRRAKIAEAAFITTVSEFNRRHLIGMAGVVHAPKIHRLYNGIDLDRFRSPQDDRESDSILAVGRLVEKKGFADLIAACGRLRAAGRRFRCTIIGEGPLQQALEEQVAAAGLDGFVELAGPLPQERLLAIMMRATIFALPCIVTGSGDRDGLPTVLLEALACGLPAISTTVSGVPEIIEHGKTGLLVKPGAPAELAQAIDMLLTSRQTRERFAAAGRRKAETDFDLAKNATTLRALFAAQANNLRGRNDDENRLRHG